VRIGLFVTCIGDTLFPQTGRAVVTLLERFGHVVAFPAAQTCCGQMHLNSGYRDEAARLARRWVRVFAGLDAVVSPSSSCVGTVRELYPELIDERVEHLYELSEFLVGKLGVEDVGASFPHRVTYHATCHSLRVTHVGDAPLRLLRNVRRLDFAELPDARECCGFGGTFAVKNADVSTAMLADKIRAIETTGAEVCTALDSSCLMHIGGGLDRLRTGIRTLHLAEILAATDRA
jgi:L-lactate dehydrogenase complex protein LldE